MNWQMVGALTGVAGLLAAFVWHLVRYAYDQGRTHARLGGVEEAQRKQAELPIEVARLRAIVETFDATVQRMSGSLDRIIDNAARPVSRARKISAA